MTPPIAEPTRMPARAGSTPSDARVSPCLARGGDREHDVALEPARILRPDDRLRLEVLDLGRDPDRKLARVEGADPVDPAPPRDSRVPRRRRVETEGCDGSETGDDDATHEGESVVASGDGSLPQRPQREPVERPADLHASIPFPPMEAELVRELPEGDEWQYEPKWDGFRGLLENGSGEVRLWSRNARPLLRYFPELRPLEKLLPPLSALDGEIVIERDGVLDFDAMQMRLHPAESRVNKLSAEIPARFIAFDVLVWKGVEAWHEPLSKRRTRLERSAKRFELSPATRDRDEALAWLDRFEAIGLDGVIAKRRDVAYLPGSRDGVVKVKPEKTADCVVVGVRWKSKPDRIATLLLGLYRDDGEVDYVGSAAVGHDARSETEFGTLRSYIETQIQYTNGDTVSYLPHAYIELGGFRVGATDSQFSSWTNYAGDLINDDVIGYGPYSDAPTNQVNYTFAGGNGFSAMIGLEQGSDGDFGYSDEELVKSYVIDDYMPHVVGGLKLEQGWGSSFRGGRI